jgi:Protein of unknown function (DUF2795)
MEDATAAAVGTLLAGMKLPATKEEILSYAGEQRAGADELAALRGLEEREYESAMDVVEALRPAQPYVPEPVPGEPREESGEPPGGEDYTA